jgi:hypothetical protein
MTPVNRFTYEGICLGGPRKGQKLISQGDPVYPLAGMKRAPFTPGMHTYDQPFIETKRGQYEWDSGIWWWRGWE